MTLEQTEDRIYDNGQIDEYPADLYQFNGIATGVDHLEDVTDAHLTQFHEQGYLVVNQAFTQNEVQDMLDGLLYLISGQNADFKGVMYEHKSQGIDVTDMPAEKRQDYVRKFMHFVDYEARLKAMTTHPKLTEVLTRMIGEAPVLFQDMALLKPPMIGREKPWHQDHAYFNVPLETTIVGVWIALDEATTENGCMIINPNSKQNGPVVHFQRRDWQICDTDVNNQSALAVPLKPGGCLFFHSLTQHGTAANNTNQRRRAVQFHYAPTSVEKTAQEDRLAIFGDEGKDVTC